MSKKGDLLVKKTLELLALKTKVEMLERETDLLMEEALILAPLGLIAESDEAKNNVADRLKVVENRMSELSIKAKSLKSKTDDLIDGHDMINKLFKNQLN